MTEADYSRWPGLAEAMRHPPWPPPAEGGLAPPSQVFVPVSAAGLEVRDNGGDVICRCFTPELAARVAALLNADAGGNAP